MANASRARGPDGGDRWCDSAAGIALVHRRLSVGDLGPTANQPLASSCGRFVLSCDGEIYNAAELISALRAAGRQFPGVSDVEVIAEGAAVWGIEATARRLDGAFAGALWDRKEHVLHLFRDRFGIRPLYWAHSSTRFFFASELKALRACPEFHAELDRDVVVAYLRWRAVPGPHTIYRGARMLEPGAILRLSIEGEPTIHRYWSLEEAVRSGQRNRFSGSDGEATQQLDGLLRKSVARRMGSAPVGTFLSGGIDSSLLLALAQDSGTKPAQSFSIGFREAAYNEAGYASAVARHLNAEHNELYVSAQHASELIPRLPEMFDEPNGDISQIPAFFLARLARQHVAAAFTGEGAAEPLGGVGASYAAANLHRRIRRWPLPARQAAKALIPLLPAMTWTRLSYVWPRTLRPPHLGDKLHKVARVLTGEEDDIYRVFRSYWQDPEAMVKGGREPAGLLEDPRVRALIPDPLERMHYIFTLTTSTQSVLAKAERSAAAAGLQVRMPFLDAGVVDFGWALPPNLKWREGKPKWLLHQVLYRYVPCQILERPKTGFDVPIGLWLRGPLRDWAEGLLAEARLRNEGVFNPQEIRAKWQEHLEERRNWQGLLWVVLMFQAWKERWLP